MKITASAPTKVIIAGEHAVVHGGTAIAVPLDVRNTVTIETTKGRKVVMKANAKRGYAPSLTAKMQTGLEAVYDYVNPSKGVVFDRKFSGMPKGCGNSASIAAAYALALYAIDRRKPTADELFDAAQEFEKEMHVNPSGIDARAVIGGSALVMKKKWTSKGGVEFDFSDRKLVLPKGTALLVVDRSGLGEKTLTTGELVDRFSRTLVGKRSSAVTQADRNKIIMPFEPVVKAIIKELNANGYPETLGELFLENNELLAKGGVIPKGMMKTVDDCLEAGCLGAKGTGACGPGGAVIALARERDVPSIRRTLEAKKLKIIPARFAKNGPKIEKRQP